MVIVMMVLSQFVEASGNYGFDLDYWEGILVLSFLPAVLGLLILVISISGTLVSGTRLVNEDLAEGEKSHNPIWGLVFWLVPIYGIYKSYVMGKSIEKLSGSERAVTTKLFVALFVSWFLSIVSEGSSRTNLDPRTAFFVGLVILGLIAATWFYIAIQMHILLREMRSVTFFQEDVQGLSEQKIEHPLKPFPKDEGVLASANHRFCTNCGQMRVLKSKFCSECGSSFS